MAEGANAAAARTGSSDSAATLIVLCRCFAWCTVAVLAAFLLNNYLDYWLRWPGPLSIFRGGSALGLVQLLLYVAAFAGGIAYVLRTPAASLRADSERIYAATAHVVRAAFWAVLLIGLADAIISFVRVEGLLPALVGDKMAIDLGRSNFRGIFVHFPMIAVAIVIAYFHRGLGFTWLALMVVAAELLIVISRFIFSYEQAFMADLVRFWYGALFLFASAYTLLEEGHVRVDVLYTNFSDRIKGLVNAVCCVLLGMSGCWVILYYGSLGESSIINGPLLSFEVTQTGFGMYVKYWMAGFLAVFAVTMLMQFSGYFLESIADYLDQPGKRKIAPIEGHEAFET